MWKEHVNIVHIEYAPLHVGNNIQNSLRGARIILKIENLKFHIRQKLCFLLVVSVFKQCLSVQKTCMRIIFSQILSFPRNAYVICSFEGVFNHHLVENQLKSNLYVNYISARQLPSFRSCWDAIELILLLIFFPFFRSALTFQISRKLFHNPFCCWNLKLTCKQMCWRQLCLVDSWIGFGTYSCGSFKREKMRVGRQISKALKKFNIIIIIVRNKWQIN